MHTRICLVKPFLKNFFQSEIGLLRHTLSGGYTKDRRLALVKGEVVF
jgi:hypothetical protein